MNKTNEQLQKEIETLTYDRDSLRDVIFNLQKEIEILKEDKLGYIEENEYLRSRLEQHN